MVSPTELDIGDGARLALAVTKSDIELRLIRTWAANEGTHGSGGLQVVRDSVEAIAQTLKTTDDAVITPVGVVWLPAEGKRASALSNVRLLAAPHRPGQHRQRLIADRSPERYRVVTGEPATVADLRARHAGETGAPSDDEAFARYVRRAAVVTLQRAQRRILGDRYKVPSLVAEQISDSAGFQSTLRGLADSLALPYEEVRARADTALGELVAVQSQAATAVFSAILEPLYARTWNIEADEEGLEELRALNRTHPLIFLPSHRSYADPLVLASVLARHDFPRNHVMGGSNLNFWPMGPLARRAGLVFIRRSFGGDEVYKTVVREYFAHLLSKRFNLEWYLEGGRTRTGKLRPPRLGLLHYVAEALQSGRAADACIVPVSITYDTLPEVAGMAAEQTGAAKQKEGLTWMAKYARAQRAGLAGDAHVRFGRPFLLRERLAPDDSTEAEQRLALQKVAFDVAVGINRCTPVTPHALMALTLLGVRDEALTVEQVRRVIAPILDYLERRAIPTTGGADLRTGEGVGAALAELQRVGVVSVYEDGAEPVFWIAPGKHIDAAFYRNNAIHWFVNRAIAELAVWHVSERPYSDALSEGWAEAKRLRDQLKFEFFFPDRDTFEHDLVAELDDMSPDWRQHAQTPESARALLQTSGFLMAGRVLRSFVDSQLVVMEQLAALEPGQKSDDRSLMNRCGAVGKQMLLQGRLHGPESLSRELFQSALKLADNRRLREGDALGRRREQEAAYARRIVAGTQAVESLDATMRVAVTRTVP